MRKDGVHGRPHLGGGSGPTYTVRPGLGFGLSGGGGGCVLLFRRLVSFMLMTVCETGAQPIADAHAQLLLTPLRCSGCQVVRVGQQMSLAASTACLKRGHKWRFHVHSTGNGLRSAQNARTRILPCQICTSWWPVWAAVGILNSIILYAIPLPIVVSLLSLPSASPSPRFACLSLCHVSRSGPWRMAWRSAASQR